MPIGSFRNMPSRGDLEEALNESAPYGDEEEEYKHHE
jgi:hypothetical protein